MKLLLLTPPLTQLNTPYPATSVLKGYLQTVGVDVAQDDLGIKLIDRIYSASFLKRLFEITVDKKLNKKLRRIFTQQNAYISSVESVMRFLRGKDSSLAVRIANRTLLPEASRFDQLGDLEWAFGVSGTIDKAKHICTLFIEDIADYIRETVDPNFDLIRYAESLSSFAPSFDELYTSLKDGDLTIVDEEMLSLLKFMIEKEHPGIIGFSIPFPGCLYSALQCARQLKESYPSIKIVMGGGFVNTELRSVRDTRLFEFIDYLILDDGELPLERLVSYIEKGNDESNLVRTFYMKGNELVYSGNDHQNIPFSQTGIPDFSGLPHEMYLSLTEMLNPMHRLWTNGKWNKMVVAHGCYWSKCAFCDTTLDYICRYEAPSASLVVDKMESIMKQTGESGFHFTDEALPPKLLKEIAEEILNRKLVVSFWGNIRFDKSYTPELCSLLSSAGCIAVSGGLEVASDRLLKLMNKGVTVQQVISAARNLTDAGIMVHAYLMYGFPTETLQETMDALRVVRDMFKECILQSAFWHRYAMTQHSHSGQHPELYGVKRITNDLNPFCNNEIDYEDRVDYDLDAIGDGLSLATYNYMHDLGFDIPLKKWFAR